MWTARQVVQYATGASISCIIEKYMDKPSLMNSDAVIRIGLHASSLHVGSTIAIVKAFAHIPAVYSYLQLKHCVHVLKIVSTVSGHLPPVTVRV